MCIALLLYPSVPVVSGSFFVRPRIVKTLMTLYIYSNT